MLQDCEKKSVQLLVQNFAVRPCCYYALKVQCCGVCKWYKFHIKFCKNPSMSKPTLNTHHDHKSLSCSATRIIHLPVHFHLAFCTKRHQLIQSFDSLWVPLHLNFWRTTKSGLCRNPSSLDFPRKSSTAQQNLCKRYIMNIRRDITWLPQRRTTSCSWGLQISSLWYSILKSMQTTPLFRSCQTTYR